MNECWDENMVVNIDDIKYIMGAFYYGFENLPLSQYETMQDIIKHKKFSMFLFVFFRFISENRCLKERYFLTPEYVRCFCISSSWEHDWPEMEEVIRKDSYESMWYSLKTGYKI